MLPRPRLALRFAPCLLLLGTCALGCGTEQPSPAAGSGGSGSSPGGTPGDVGGRGAGRTMGGSGAAGGGTFGGGASGSAGGGLGGLGGGGEAAGAGGATGDGDGATREDCGRGPWSCVVVPGGESYGARTFDVPAQQNWVNTGLYLREGEVATISESGTWQLEGVGAGIDHGPCKVGDMVARIGLHYKDSALTCVKGEAEFQAPRDGVLFVGALAGNDLGETYETRATASGTKRVAVTSSAATVPTVLASEAVSYDFDVVDSGWVEVWGEHVILTLPVATAKKDASVMAAATARLDAIYELEAELRGALPHHGQRIRFFPDGTQPGYMLAGNPIRMATELVSGGDSTRISRAGEDGTDVWGFAHELGHDFSFAPRGFWTYQENTIESWCNLFTIYALERLQLPLHDDTKSCNQSSQLGYAGWDAWGGLCFLRQFQFRYGWEFYERFFAQIKDTTSTGGSPWGFVRQQFDAAAEEDTSAIFDAWGVPK